jgi:prolyl-tRNA editing enzyme YbaK/EbsC (Cys-tRNA(Pro) deacylase)
MTALVFLNAHEHPELLATTVAAALPAGAAIEVAAVDPALADTAAFCEAYDQAPEASANCIVVEGVRGDVTTYAACVVLATTRADVNGTIRKLLDARTARFAPMDAAVAMTGMEYGGITPIGLPAEWRLLVDSRVVALPRIIIGAGIRGAKLFLPGDVLAGMPNAEVIEGLASTST